MGATTPFPEVESAALEACAVYSAADIATALGRLRDGRSFVTVYCDGGPAFAVTALIEIRRDAQTVVFDHAAEAHANACIGRAGRLVFVGFSDQVKIQFETGRAITVQHDGLPAWCVRLPTRLIRMQRREAFRVSPPIGRPAWVEWQCGDGAVVRARLLDLSIGGLRLRLEADQGAAQQPGKIESCVLSLPGAEPLTIDLLVRHIVPRERIGEGAIWGCEFYRISPGTELLLQRYIQQLQLDVRRLRA